MPAAMLYSRINALISETRQLKRVNETLRQQNDELLRHNAELHQRYEGPSRNPIDVFRSNPLDDALTRLLTAQPPEPLVIQCGGNCPILAGR